MAPTGVIRYDVKWHKYYHTTKIHPLDKIAVPFCATFLHT